MDLVDKVLSGLPAIDYSARECMDSRRKTLVFHGVEYCMLSSESIGVYCPLQAERDRGEHISKCLRQDYLRELEENGRRLRDGDKEKGRDRD